MIKVTKIIVALKRMNIGKVLRPVVIPIEVWKYMRDDNLLWLTKLFNNIDNVLV